MEYYRATTCIYDECVKVIFIGEVNYLYFILPIPVFKTNALK